MLFAPILYIRSSSLFLQYLFSSSLIPICIWNILNIRRTEARPYICIYAKISSSFQEYERLNAVLLNVEEWQKKVSSADECGVRSRRRECCWKRIKDGNGLAFIRNLWNVFGAWSRFGRPAATIALLTLSFCTIERWWPPPLMRKAFGSLPRPTSTVPVHVPKLPPRVSVWRDQGEKAPERTAKRHYAPYSLAIVVYYCYYHYFLLAIILFSGYVLGPTTTQTSYSCLKHLRCTRIMGIQDS